MKGVLQVERNNQNNRTGIAVWVYSYWDSCMDLFRLEADSLHHGAKRNSARLHIAIGA